jgi:hypothetical protein
LNLVNDLDLTITSPTGTVYRGNVFSGGWSQTGGSADRINNVENVYVQSAASGVWTVQVSGFNAPQGPQPFALVVNGNFGVSIDNPPTVSITTPADGATVSGSQAIEATASDDIGVTQVEFFVDEDSLGVDTSAPYAVTWDTTTAADGAYTLTAIARDTPTRPPAPASTSRSTILLWTTRPRFRSQRRRMGPPSPVLRPLRPRPATTLG